jgi:hypothetical protein
MGKLTDAAKQVILGEDSKGTFDSNIRVKMSQRGGERAPHGEVGADKLSTSIVPGQQDVGMIGQSPERSLTDDLPNYLKGVPTATPPGATPPQGSEKDGVGITKSHGPQDTEGRKDIMDPVKSDATDYETIRDRKPGKLAPQMMQANPGATFQSYAEDIDAMLSGENLSEEFKTKATTIFEAAVIARSEQVIAEAEATLMEEFESAVEQIKEDLASKVDDYLNYMVEEWVKENEIAIQTGLKAEIVEDFIKGLKGLFEEHYIDIPEDKVDVVEELTTKVAELEESLNEQINTAVAMKKELNEHKKYEAIYTACEGLTQTQVEKMKSLAEGVEFTTEEEFTEKLETIKESYFNNLVKTADSSALDDEVQIEEEVKTPKVSSDPLIEQVARSISQSKK